MRVTLISTEGPWLEAKVKAGDRILTVMDEFSIDEGTAPTVNSEFDVELSAFVDEDGSWEEMFSGNPERKREVRQLDGWRYQAFGKVISIDPVVVDCGLLEIPDVFHSNDSRVVGEFISFMISRLDATQYAQQAGR